MATERVIIEVQARGTRTVQRQINEIGVAASNTTKLLRLLRAGLVIVAGIRVFKQFVEFADTLTLVRNRLRLVTRSEKELTAVERALFAASQRTRTSFEDNATLFNKMVKSTNGLGLSFRDLLEITEGINQAVKISGSTVQESTNAIRQFAQGLTSGALQGDELRSVTEQFQKLADVIGKEFGVEGGELISFAKANEGILKTSKVLIAVTKALPELGEEFKEVRATVADAFIIFNDVLVVFIGNLLESVVIGERVDAVLQSIARNLPEITLALLTIASIGIFNLLITQITLFASLILGLAGFILSPFLALGALLISIAGIVSGAVIGAFSLLLTSVLAIGGAIVTAGTALVGFLASLALAKAAVLTIVGLASAFAAVSAVAVGVTTAIFGLSKAILATFAAAKILTLALITMRGAALAFIAAATIMRARLIALAALGGILAGLKAAFLGIVVAIQLVTVNALRMLAVLFLNPFVLGFAVVLAAIIAAWILFGDVISSLIPNLDTIVNAINTLFTGILSGIQVVISSWRLFGPALADIFIQAINAILEKATSFFQFFIDGVNNILKIANNLGGDFELIDPLDSPELKNEFAGSAKELATTFNDTFAANVKRGGAFNIVKEGFEEALGALRDFLPKELTDELDALLDRIPGSKKGPGAEADDKTINKIRKAFESLSGSVDPLIAGMNKLANAQEVVNKAVEKGITTQEEGARILDLLAKQIAGVDTANFEFSQRQKLVNQLLADNKISTEEAASALRDMEIAAQGAFVSSLNGLFPLVEGMQRLAEIQQFVTKNSDRLSQSGISQGEATKRLAREAAGLTGTYEQMNEQVEFLRRNQDLLGLSTEELEAEVRRLNIAFLETQRDAASGAQRAILKLVDETTDAAAQTEKAFTDAFKKIEDAVVSFATNGKFEIDEFFRSIAEHLIRLGTQQALAGIGGFFQDQTGGQGGFGFGGPSSSSVGGGGIGGIFTSLLGGLFGFQNGGQFTVGANTAVQAIPGIDNRLIAFRAQDGEQVSITPKGQQAGGQNINQIFNINTPNPDSFKRSQSQIQNRALAGIDSAKRRR